MCVCERDGGGIPRKRVGGDRRTYYCAPAPKTRSVSVTMVVREVTRHEPATNKSNAILFVVNTRAKVCAALRDCGGERDKRRTGRPDGELIIAAKRMENGDMDRERVE